MSYYCKGSEILVGELLRGARRPEVFSLHINFISYLEVWRSCPFSICRALIVFLRKSHFRAEELVEFLKVGGIFLCSG